MDPVSLSLGIAGILPLVATAISTCKEYIDNVRLARKSIATLITELEALQANVTNLHELLKSDSLNDNALRFRNSSVLLTCSAACEAKLKALCKQLGQEGKGTRSRLWWPFSEKDYQKTIQELRNFSNWMQFALSVDGCRLLSQTSDDVLKLMEEQLEQFKTVQGLEASTLRILDVVTDQKRTIQNNIERERRKSILNWISTSRHYQKHRLIQASRAQNTGTWILQEKNLFNGEQKDRPRMFLSVMAFKARERRILRKTSSIPALGAPADGLARLSSMNFLRQTLARLHQSRTSISIIKINLLKVHLQFYAVS